MERRVVRGLIFVSRNGWDEVMPDPTAHGLMRYNRRTIPLPLAIPTRSLVYKIPAQHTKKSQTLNSPLLHLHGVEALHAANPAKSVPPTTTSIRNPINSVGTSFANMLSRTGKYLFRVASNSLSVSRRVWGGWFGRGWACRFVCPGGASGMVVGREEARGVGRWRRGGRWGGCALLRFKGGSWY